MERSEILRRLKTLEIKSKGLTRHLFTGEYHSAFKGKGMTFSEVREYQPGDEVRTIDWNVTARTQTPHIKVFEEERELNILLLIDDSGSMNFGSSQQTKRDLALEIAAALACSAQANKDKVGALFFTNKMEQYIAPGKGRKQVMHILNTALQRKLNTSYTRIESALQFVERTQKKRSVCFLISDFTDSNDFMESLQRVRKKHDLICIQVGDKEEYTFNEKGWIQLYHAETKETNWVNAADKNVRQQLIQSANLRKEALKKNLASIGIDFVSMNTQEDIYLPLMRLFKNRS